MRDYQKKLNGWQRIGIIISLLWILAMFVVAAKEIFDWMTSGGCWGASHPNNLFINWVETMQPCPERCDPLNLLFLWKGSFRIGRFFSLLILPVIAGWVGSYCVLWVACWVKEGFKQTRKNNNNT